MAMRIWSMISSMRSSSTMTFRVSGMALLSLNNSSRRSMSCRMSITASVERMTLLLSPFRFVTEYLRVFLNALGDLCNRVQASSLISQRVRQGVSVTQTHDFFFQSLIDMRGHHAGNIPPERSDLLDRTRGKEHMLLGSEQGDRFDVAGEA